MKILKGKTALFAVNILIILILSFSAELLARIFYPEIILSGTSSNLIRENKFSETHGLNPSSEGMSYGVIKKVDGRGFWKYSGNKSNVSKKILLIGDSVTMGIGVESDSTFAGILHNKLNTYEILNSSLIAYTSKDYLNQITALKNDEELMASLDKIYLFWCLNDVYPRHILDDAPGYTGDDFISSIVKFLRENSKLYHLMKNVFSDRPHSYFLFDSQFYTENNPDFKRSMNNIKKISRITGDNKIEFDLFLVPYEYQIRVDSKENFHPQQLIKEKLSGLNINIYDCADAFLNINMESENLYLYGDGIHLSNKGHKLLAKYIFSQTEL
jgi:hypothetical protein